MASTWAFEAQGPGSIPGGGAIAAPPLTNGGGAIAAPPEVRGGGAKGFNARSRLRPR